MSLKYQNPNAYKPQPTAYTQSEIEKLYQLADESSKAMRIKNNKKKSRYLEEVKLVVSGKKEFEVTDTYKEKVRNAGVN